MQDNIIKYVVQVRRLEPAKNIWFKYGDLNQQRVQVRRLEPAKNIWFKYGDLNQRKSLWFKCGDLNQPRIYGSSTET